MPRRRLDSYVSNRIARTNPLEGGPAFEAWQNGTNVMASTWGDYASRLAELLEDDIPLDGLLGKLCIGRLELQDPTVHFGTRLGWEFDDYMSHFQRVTHNEALDYYAPEIKRLQMTLDAILEGYKVPDVMAAREESGRIQDEIAEAEELFDDNSRTSDEEREAHLFGQTERCMRRDALDSGVIIPIDEFVSTLLSVNLIQDGDFKSDLAQVWVRALKNAVESFLYDWDYAADIPAGRVVLGRDTFMEMRAGLGHIWREQEAHREQRWKEVEPVFITNYIQEHPLITGEGEK